MEELTKTQLILLALLVSFVTSMATGIVAVTLMEQAPEPVVQTINRIVERTVETVREAVPVAEKSQRQSVVTKETTVVVKEEDLITSTIAKNLATLVRISARLGATSEEEFIGLGSVVAETGIVATDAAFLPPAPSTLRATLSDGTSYALIAFPGTGDTGIAFLKLSEIATSSESVPTPDKKFAAALFADASALKLGQTVIALGGRSRTSVAMGIISALVLSGGDEDTRGRSNANSEAQASSTTESARPQRLSALETTLAAPLILPGTPVFNIFGELVALAVSAPQEGAAREYIAVNRLAVLLAAVSRSGTALDTR